MRPTRTLVGLVAVSAALLPACVLPDFQIGIVDEGVQNKHPVRFVEPTPVTNEAANICLALLGKKTVTATAVCQPADPATVLPPFLDPTLQEDGEFPYRFCSCDAQESDTIRLPAVTLYAEDRANDVDVDEPIFAALQLDLRPDETEPQKTVEYVGYVDPNASLDEPQDLKYAPPRRPNEAAGRKLRVVSLGFAEDRIDLCNGAGTTPLPRGFHTLRVLVTDTPWFTPPPGKDGVTRPQQVGVPDLTNGATYDTMTYIFHCDDKTDAHCDQQCQVPE